MNDAKTKGVYVHASDNSNPVHYFSPKWTCNDSGNIYFTSGDAFLIHLTTNAIAGAWCNEPPTLQYNFICEGLI